MKKQKDHQMRSLTIDIKVVKSLKEFCKERGMVMSHFAAKALIEKMDEMKESEG